MSTKTGISWTDATWNPIRGCSRVSEGCRHCYAERVAYRFSGPGQPYEGLVQVSPVGDRCGLCGADLKEHYDESQCPVGNGTYNSHLTFQARTSTRLPKWNGQVRFVEEHLLDPLRWKKPRRIFVNSMSDLFHENVTDEMRDKIFAVMALCPQHTFQVLTKRPERMLDYTLRSMERPEPTIEACKLTQAHWPRLKTMPKGLSWDVADLPGLVTGALPWPLPNVWLGVSVEDQAATHRINTLRQIPAAVRYLSLEPLLQDLGQLDLTGIDWVIVGGESGPGARPMHPDWARSLRDQCKSAGVPFFFKQWGEWWPGSDARAKELTLYSDGRTCEFTKESIEAEERRSGRRHRDYAGTITSRVGTKSAGHLLDGVEHHAFPEAR